MKILEITRSYYPSIGGMEKFVSDRQKIYDNLGIDYKVITSTHSEIQLSGTKKLNDVTYLPLYTPYGFIPDLAQTIRKNNYDILSVNQVNYYYAWQAVKQAKQDGKKIIVTPHFHFHTQRFKLLKNLHSKFIIPQIFEAANKIICFTKHEANYWTKLYQNINEKIVIIPHYFSAPKVKTENEGKFGKFILFIGRGERNKRIDLLIKGFNRIKTEYNLVLTVFEREVNTELLDIVKKNKRIHLIGRVSETEKHNLLFSSQALILLSDFEAFGIVPFEASYYKKPLLLSDLPVFREIHSPEGVIFIKNNISDVTEKINAFIQLNENEKKKMGEINFNNLKNYSFEKISQKYSKILCK